MKIEIRADNTAQITGYVNTVERKSRPVITPHGKCIEVVQERAFEKAIEVSGNVNVTVDHDNTHIYASTDSKTLELYEDGIGLHASVIITDKSVIELAKTGKIKGWSFGMYNVVDELEQRAGELPIRHIKSLHLDHITLVVNKTPCYSATSVELRADEDVDIEVRSIQSTVELTENRVQEKPDFSYHTQEIEILKLKGERT
jgi:HK97 family phage prohead protease